MADENNNKNKIFNLVEKKALAEANGLDSNTQAGSRTEDNFGGADFGDDMEQGERPRPCPPGYTYDPELDICLELYTGSSNSINSINKNNLHHKLILQEWLDRSESIGLKVKFLSNKSKKNINSIDIGVIEGLSNEGFLKIRTESGQLITHVSGEIIEFTNDII